VAANKRMDSAKKLNVKKDSNEHSLKFGQKYKIHKETKANCMEKARDILPFSKGNY
jgi:hypothetical protein